MSARKAARTATPAAGALPDWNPDVTVEIVVESDLWLSLPGIDSQIESAIAKASRYESQRESRSAPLASLVSVLLADDSAIRTLNAQWRGQDKPTNVLSFPANAPPGLPGPKPLGDLALSYETVVSEAVRDGKPVRNHVAHLAVHGFLHLIGYDHESEDAAAAMEQLERNILAQLDIPDPYDDRDAP